MLSVVHYEPKDFFTIVSVKGMTIFPRVMVLDKGIAGLVYMCKDGENLCYLDRFYPSNLKEEEYNKLDAYEVHKELYVKINLDKSLRMN